MSVSGDDTARRRFLATLVEALDARWVAGYAIAKQHGVLGLTLRREGIDGFVQVVPSVVSDHGISWRPFPGNGTAHFDLTTDSGEYLRTCVVAQAVTLLDGWVKARGPVTPSAPEPMLPTMRPRLEAIARAEPPTLEDAIEEGSWALTDAGRAQIASMRASLDAASITRAFPRGDDGRIALGARALLARIDSSKRLAATRRLYLIVRGPRVRKDGGRLALDLADAIEDNESHAWLHAPWLWRTTAKPPPPDPRSEAYAALVDDGRFAEALAVFSLALSPSATKVLEGVPLSVHDSAHAPAWREAMRRLLWELSPWLVPRHVTGRLRLLPNQRHARKAWVALGKGTIDIERTGSNARLPEIAWRRQVSFDLARLGIAQAAAVPTKATSIAKAAPTPATPVVPLAEAIAGKARWKAKRALDLAKKRPQPDAMRELLAIARGGGTRDERANAMWIASEIVTEADGSALEAFLGHPDDEVRRMAIEGIKRAGHVAAIPALAALINGTARASSGRSYQFDAATALKALSGRRGDAALVGYLDDADPRVREAACHAIGGYDTGYGSAVPHLERCTGDVDAAVAAAAKKALTAITNRS